MYHFFVEPSQIGEKEIVITGPDVNHIKNVIRLKVGDEISISNGIDGRDYRSGIKEINDTSVICELRFIKEDGVELGARVHLFQGLPKGDKMELIIQKMVELGVYEIIPVDMKRCIMKLDSKKEDKKIARWQGISEAAAKQSKRAIVPQIHECMSFKEAIKLARSMQVKLVPYELEAGKGMDETRRVLETIKLGDDVAIFIGPEGGFDESEIKLALENEFSLITLGRRILRTETAGMTTMAFIMYLLEE